MATIIPTKDDPNYNISIDLESKIYNISFLYNTVGDFWTMSLATSNNETILTGIKIVPNYPLTFNYKNELLPEGDFYCEITDSKASIVRNSFSSGEAILLYLTKEEVEQL